MKRVLIFIIVVIWSVIDFIRRLFQKKIRWVPSGDGSKHAAVYKGSFVTIERVGNVYYAFIRDGETTKHIEYYNLDFAKMDIEAMLRGRT